MILKNLSEKTEDHGGKLFITSDKTSFDQLINSEYIYNKHQISFLKIKKIDKKSMFLIILKIKNIYSVKQLLIFTII